MEGGGVALKHLQEHHPEPRSGAGSKLAEGFGAWQKQVQRN